ncbi:unnamed protein product [Rhizopus stolonifer]
MTHSTQIPVSGSSHISNTSNDSQAHLTSQQTTWFLLDVNDDNAQSRRNSSSSSSSSSSSVSAQVVIDHVLPTKPSQLRSEEESESDYALSSPARRDSDVDRRPPRSH